MNFGYVRFSPREGSGPLVTAQIRSVQRLFLGPVRLYVDADGAGGRQVPMLESLVNNLPNHENPSVGIDRIDRLGRSYSTIQRFVEVLQRTGGRLAVADGLPWIKGSPCPYKLDPSEWGAETVAGFLRRIERHQEKVEREMQVFAQRGKAVGEWGRPRMEVSGDVLELVPLWREQGQSWEEICARVGVSESTLRRRLRENFSVQAGDGVEVEE